MGVEVPKNFGLGMTEASIYTGISCNPDTLLALDVETL